MDGEALRLRKKQKRDDGEASRQQSSGCLATAADDEETVVWFKEEQTKKVRLSENRVRVSDVLEAFGARRDADCFQYKHSSNGAWIRVSRQQDGYSSDTFRRGDVYLIQVPKHEVPGALGELVPSPVVQARLSDPVNWEEACFAPTQSSLASTYLLRKLDNYADEWDGGMIYQAPFAVIVQSSGWGKSRTICDLRKFGVFVIYYSFMKREYSGYPRGSKSLSSCFAPVTEASVCTYLVACLEVLAANQMTAEEWCKVQVTSGDIDAAIFESYTKLESIIAKQSVVELQNALDDALSKLRKAKYRQLRRGALQVVFAFDEAKSMPEFETTFLVFRKALGYIPVGSGLFITFSDTNPAIANFNLAPHRELDPTGRSRTYGQKMFDPLHLVGTSDIFSPRPWRSHRDMVKHETLFKLGRPLWGAHLANCKLLSTRRKVKELVSFAMWKIGGGSSPKDVKNRKEVLTREEAAAVFTFTIAAQVVFESRLAHKLVAGYMVTCIATDDDTRRVVTMVVSEPVLGEAAARLLHDCCYLLPGLDILIDLVKEGLLVEGERGELVARLILLLAVHQCARDAPYVARAQQPSLQDDHHQSNGNEVFEDGATAFGHTYTAPVRMADYLKKLFGDDWDASKCESKHPEAALVHFNQFVPLADGVEITKQKLWECWCHGSALVYAPGKYASDVGIPWAEFNSNGSLKDVGILETQVKGVISKLDQDPNLKTGRKDLYPFLEQAVVERLHVLLNARMDLRIFLKDGDLEMAKQIAPVSLG